MAKPIVELELNTHIPLIDCTFCLCIDDSISTDRFMGNTNSPTFLDTEMSFASKLKAYINTEPMVSTLNLSPEMARKTDVLVVITDDLLEEHTIQQLNKIISANGIQLKAMIGVIVGNRGDLMVEAAVDSMSRMMCDNHSILYYNTVNTFVARSSGIFAPVWNLSTVDHWTNLCVDLCEITNIMVPVACSEDISRLTCKGYVQMAHNQWFRPDLIGIELVDYPFERICSYYQLNGNLDKLTELGHQIKLKVTSNGVTSNDLLARDRDLCERYMDEDFDLDDILINHQNYIRCYKFISEIINEISFTMINNYDFTEPYKWLKQYNQFYPNHKSNAYRCDVCGNTDVPFVVHHNGTIMAEIMCSKCADYFCHKLDRSYAIPLVDLSNGQKMFMDAYSKVNDQPLSMGQRLSSFCMGFYDVDYRNKVSVKILCEAMIKIFNENLIVAVIIDAFRKQFD